MKKISCVLLSIMLLSLCSFSSFAQANSHPKSTMDDDDFVCYFMGEPIYSCCVDEYGIIRKCSEHQNSIQLMSTWGNGYNHGSLYAAHKNEQIQAEGTLQAYKFHQDESYVFLPYDKAVAWGNALSNFSLTSGIIGTVGGISSKVIGIILGLSSGAAGLLATDINSHINHSSKTGVVIVRLTPSTGSAVLGVHSWDQKTCIKSGKESGTSGQAGWMKTTVNSVTCAHGNVW